MARPAAFDREAILDALMRTFWEHGFETSSLDRLEKATGLKRQSLYNAFGDKEAMFVAALDRYAIKIGEPLSSLLEQVEPLAAVRNYLDGHIKVLTDHCTPTGCLVATCSAELAPRKDELGTRLRGDAAAAIESIAAVFRVWQLNGKLAVTAEPEELAALLTAITRGLAALSRSGADPVTLARAVDGAVAAFNPFLTADSSD